MKKRYIGCIAKRSRSQMTRQKCIMVMAKKQKKSFLSLFVAISVVLFLCFIISISINIPISTVSAYTKINASTKTDLSTSGGDLTVLRLKPAYDVKTPDLWFEAEGEATTVINASSSASIQQNYAALATKKGQKVIAGGAVTCFYSATNVKEIKTNLSSEVSVKRGMNVVRTSVSGTSLASPGRTDADYEFSLSGSHRVTTDAAPVITESKPDADAFKIITSFENYTRQMDFPADITEVIKVTSNMEDGVLSYGYDYASIVKANDITCTSSMSYRKGGVGEEEVKDGG